MTLIICESLREIGEMACVTSAWSSRGQTLNMTKTDASIKQTDIRFTKADIGITKTDISITEEGNSITLKDISNTKADASIADRHITITTTYYQERS